MDIKNLVKMANSIGDFFSAEPDREVGVAGITQHLKNFWERRMQSAIIRHYEAGGEGLTDLVKAAVGQLAKNHAPKD